MRNRQSCGNCQFSAWEPWNKQWLICQRYPAKIKRDTAPDEVGRFPAVRDADWCGEWQAKDKIIGICPYADYKNDKDICPSTAIVCPGWEFCPYYKCEMLESDEDLFCQQCSFYGPVYIRGKIVGYDCQALPGQEPDGCPIIAELTGTNYTGTNCTADITPNNLMAAISRIDQFMKRNPDAKIEFYVHSFISIRGTITTQKHLCVDLLLDQNTWSIEETYFERLILALAKKIVQIEDLLTHGDCS